MCRRLHQKFWGLDKDTHHINKPCKYHPLKTRNNDGIILGKFLPSEASAMLGCPKLEFRAPVGALWGNWGLIILVRFLPGRRSANTFKLSEKTPEANFFKPQMVDLWFVSKIVGTRLDELGSRSLSFQSGTQFTLSSR